MDFCHLFTPSKGLFAPTSQSPMSIFFRNPWEKSNRKKWCHIVKLLLIKDLKSPHEKKLVFWRIVFFNNLSLFYFLVIYHMSPVTSHLSVVTCHLSPVTRHLSTVTYQLLLVTCLLTITECLDV